MVTPALEGTWEEIQKHGAYLAGRYVRVELLDNGSETGPNESMLSVLGEIKSSLEVLPYSNETKTQHYLREGRDGGMFGQ